MEVKGSKPTHDKDFFFAEARKKHVKINKINKFIINTKGSTNGTGKRK